MRPDTLRTLSVTAATVVVSLVALTAPAGAGTGSASGGIATTTTLPRAYSVSAAAPPAAVPSTTTAPSGVVPTTTTLAVPSLGAPSTGEGSGVLSLTALLVKHQADGMGVDLSAFLRERSADLDSRLGTGSVFSSPAFRSMTAGGASFDDLNTQLVSSSFGSGDWAQMTTRLAAAANTPDGRTVAGAVKLTQDAGGLKPVATPALQMPQLAGAGTILSAGRDQMAFALFANQSVAQAFKNSPDLLGQVRSGQLSPSSLSQFRAGASAAAANFSQGLGSTLGSPCYAGMVLGAATGSGAGAKALNLPSSCSPCITAGTYLYGRMGDVMSTGTYTSNPNDGRTTQYEWANMDPTTKAAILKQNPQLARQLAAASKKSSSTNVAASGSACQQAAKGTSNFLVSNLGSVLGRLGG